MPVCFCEMDASWAFVVCGSFDSMHVSTSWKMIMGKFDDEDLGAVLENVKGFAWGLPVDGVKGMLGPVVPFHEFLAKLWAASCYSESLMGESPGDGFTVNSEAGFGGWNERDDFGWF